MFFVTANMMNETEVFARHNFENVFKIPLIANRQLELFSTKDTVYLSAPCLERPCTLILCLFIAVEIFMSSSLYCITFN